MKPAKWPEKIYRERFTVPGQPGGLWLYQPGRKGLKRGNGTRCDTEQGPAATSERGTRNGVAPYSPASVCRDAKSAGHGAPGAA
ncbi:hypothetical protein OD635_005023 [Salmonella enterica]|nr:hypothetical protein [Salmonella enterica]